MKKKYYWLIGIIALLLFIAVPAIHVFKTKWSESDSRSPTPKGFANDVSELSLTKVDTIIPVAKDQQAIQKQLQEILKYARTHSLKISIAGAKHSMGGHTIYPDGIVLNMLPYKTMEFDTASNILSVGSGALWEDAINYLDKYGKSIAVMQAFSSFSIGGSLSVNGHGWQKDSPPISSSVISFTLMDYTGKILNCSRTENSEMFKLVVGGYGLFGIILDLKLHVVDNNSLEYHYVGLSSTNYLKNYKQFVADNPKVKLVFGRLRISNKHFLEDATLNFFEEVPVKPISLAAQSLTTMKRNDWFFEAASTANTESDCVGIWKPE